MRESDDRSGAIVYMTGFAKPATAPVGYLNQRDENFDPRILPVVAGQTVTFPNHDRICHKIFSVSAIQPFDLGHYKSSDPEHKRFKLDIESTVSILASPEWDRVPACECHRAVPMPAKPAPMIAMRKSERGSVVGDAQRRTAQRLDTESHRCAQPPRFAKPSAEVVPPTTMRRYSV